VSKIANWGRWLIAAYLVVRFAFDEWKGAAQVDWHKLGDLALEFVVIGVWFAVVCGVLTWANWAHALLVLFNSVGLIAYAFRIVSGKAYQLGKFWPVNFVFGIVMLIWLLLPSVRAEYWNPEHVS
jgi:hypothetical protein